MKAFGASGSQITATIASQKALAGNDVFDVEYDNWGAYEIFNRMWTQWRIHDFSGTKIGIDYVPLIEVIKLSGAHDPLEMLDKVRLIEHGYLKEVNK